MHTYKNIGWRIYWGPCRNKQNDFKPLIENDFRLEVPTWMPITIAFTNNFRTNKSPKYIKGLVSTGFGGKREKCLVLLLICLERVVVWILKRGT